MGKKQFCFFQTAETGNRTPDSGVKGSGANHYPRAPAQIFCSRATNRFHRKRAALSMRGCEVAIAEDKITELAMAVLSAKNIIPVTEL